MHICLYIIYSRSCVTIPQLNNGQERHNTATNQGCPLPSGFMNLCRRGGRKPVTPRAVEGQTHTGTHRDTHRSSQRLWPHALALHRPKPDQVPALRREGGHEFPSLAWICLQLTNSSHRWNGFSPMEAHWIYNPLWSAGRVLSCRRPTQNRTHIFFENILWAFLPLYLSCA